MHKLPMFLALAAALTLAAPAAVAQKKDNKDKKDGQLKEGTSGVRGTENEQVDMRISEALGAWQIGDAAMLHKYYADDVIVVSGLYEPPIRGWEAYAQAYQRQMARLESVRKDRFNTYITVKGTYAWAAFQWEFSGLADGKTFAAKGHTTMVLERRGDQWLIVHDHTSMVEQSQPKPKEAPAPPAQDKPGK